MQRASQEEMGRLSAIFVVIGIFFSQPCVVEAQLFNGGGLFNKKTDAPRAQTEDEIGVPVPVTGRVEALKGHELQFEIRAESKTPGATVEFLIRTFPSAGKIVSMVSKPYERNKAIVTYYADPSSSATSDAFAFAVRYRGGRYSSEMRFDIDLVDLKTEIQAPPSVDFGEIMVGDEAVREITIRNLGNGTMDRQVFLASPWYLLEPADGKFTLGPNGARVLKIAFRPELMGETSYILSFSRSKEGTTKLIGKGADPFQVVSDSLELSFDELSRERRGEIALLNPGVKPLRVEARASTRIQNGMLEGYLLAPGKTTKVPVKLEATDTAPFDGTVQFFLKNGYSKAVRVISPVVPGKIEVKVANAISSEVINFGKVEAGRSGERGLTITNTGGVAVPLEFHIPEPFRLLTNPGPQLGPLSSVAISVGLYPTASARGAIDVTMNVYSSEQTLPIRLLGNVVAPSGGGPNKGGALSGSNLPSKTMRLSSSSSKADVSGGTAVPILATTPETNTGAQAGSPAGSSPSAGLVRESGKGGVLPLHASPEETGTFPGLFSSESRSLTPRKIDKSLRAPEDLTVIEAGSETLVIGWTAPKDTGPCSFEVEVRAVLFDPKIGQPENVWVVYPAVKQDRIDRLVKAKIQNLNPVSSYEFRVVLTTEDGRSSEPSEVLPAQTGLPMDWTYIYLFLGIGLIVLLGIGVWKVIQGRRPEVYQTQYVDV